MTPLELAILFHETYERLAPTIGYETRKDTRLFDPESKNGKLMVAVCGAILERPRTALSVRCLHTSITGWGTPEARCDACGTTFDWRSAPRTGCSTHE